MDFIEKIKVIKKEDNDVSIDKIQDILSAGEEVEFVFANVRDKIWFTNKRIITMKVQGLTATKYIYSFFYYKKMNYFSVGTSGYFRGDSSLRIWMGGVGVFEFKFHKSINIKEIMTLINKYI